LRRFLAKRTTPLSEHHQPNSVSGRFAQIAPWLSDSPIAFDCLPHEDDYWRAFTESVSRQRLAGLVLAHADSSGTDVPSAVRAALRDSAARVAAENLHMMHELGCILHAFNRRGLSVMLLKGAALNLTIYQHADLRPMSDVDLLVRPCDAQRALRLLHELGCTRGSCLIRDDFFPKYHYEVEFFIPSARPVRIDLHARPLRPLRLARIVPDDAFWEGAREVRVGSTKTQIPRAEFGFIHLAAHAAYHGCSRLIWLYDIKRFTDAFAEKMDWALVTARCRQWRLSLAVREAIAHTEAIFGSICPRAVTAELAGHCATWRDRLTLRHAPRDSSSPISHVVCNLLCTPGVLFRLGYLAALLLPGRNHLAELYKRRHPGWLLCAHAWRIVRGLWRALAAPFVKFAAAPAR